MKISIVIPTSLGREKEIKETVKSILSSDLRNVKEIILAIDKSKEILKYALRLRKKNKKIKINFSPIRRGRCKAKNEAAKIAKGDILLFLDDDTKIEDRNYLTTILSDLKKSKRGAVSAQEIKLKKKSKLKEKIFGKKIGVITKYGEVIGNFELNPGKPLYVDALPGCNFAVRKEVFFKVGGFDEAYDIGTAYREETDLQVRIRKYGYKLVFDPRTYVIHKEKEDKRGFKKWVSGYYLTNTYFYLKNFCKSYTDFLLFLSKEFFTSVLRTIIYKSPYPILYYPKIFSGVVYYRKMKKIVLRNKKSVASYTSI